jgi:ribosome-associated translation inhibitor RaiA
MHVEVHGQNVEITPVLRASIEGRLAAALHGLGDDVQRVTVRLHEPPRPESGLLTQCAILLSFRPSGGLQVRYAAPAAADAVGRAVDEARRALGRRRVARHRPVPATRMPME